MKIMWFSLILALGTLLVPTLACGGDGETNPTTCEIDRDAIQVAFDAYYNENGEWPTADGDPGDIEWDELVPDFLSEIPSTDSKCDWQVNSDPEGEVCLWKHC